MIKASLLFEIKKDLDGLAREAESTTSKLALQGITARFEQILHGLVDNCWIIYAKQKGASMTSAIALAEGDDLAKALTEAEMENHNLVAEPLRDNLVRNGVI